MPKKPERKQGRVPPGVSIAGQWVAVTHPESPLEIVDQHPDGSAPEDLVTPSETALDPGASRADVLALLDPQDHPTVVRALAASSPHPGVAEIAATDPNPVVRAIARDGRDLSPETAEELDGDPAVRQVRELLGA